LKLHSHLDGLPAILGLGNDFDVFGGFQQDTQALSNYGVVVSQKDRDLFHISSSSISPGR
jgi:hypothetical protein